VLNIVLVEPEIPMNTGNIARSCAATKSRLHLIKPLGFDISERAVKRAGLDYWHLVEVFTYDSFAEFTSKNPGARCWFLSTKAAKPHTAVSYAYGDFLVFGKETKGLSESLLRENYENCVRIPMRKEARSLNLANSVAVVLYEALRQLDFPGLSDEGSLTGRVD